ncbi:MAG: amidohydrolase [Desulfobacterales bacterium]|nr:amidohydrolase [Desulfobacterales bacterium]
MTIYDPTPELILFNGNFRTMDPARPRARAAAVGRGRILAVGDDNAIRPMAGANTRQIDLEGRLGLPGFIDGHFHFYEWAMTRQWLDLSVVESFSGCIDRVKAAAAKAEPGKCILGLGFNESDWPENRMPNRADLDAAAPENPVVLWRCDLHLAAANSPALELAGIRADTPAPTKGVIERDRSGEPTGVLRDIVIDISNENESEPTVREAAEALSRAIKDAHSLGITGVHDVRLLEDDAATIFKSWQLCRDSGDLALRAWVGVPGERIDEAAALGMRTGFGDDLLRLGHVKYFADGGMGARTAWMLEPYLDAGSGAPLTPMKDLETKLEKAHAAGLALMIHSIGDRTNRELIRMFQKHEARHEKSGPPGWAPPAVPHRIEHIQMIRPEDIPELARLNVVGCVQPHNLVLDINMIDQCVGPKGANAYAFRALLDAGVPLMFSSDCPVGDPSPLVGVHAAVTRCRKDGSPHGGWHPHQKITVDEAVRGYTVTPARASGAGDRLGSITPGKRADIIALDRDIYTIDPMEIINARVVMTLFDGNIVHQEME